RGADPAALHPREAAPPVRRRVVREAGGGGRRGRAGLPAADDEQLLAVPDGARAGTRCRERRYAPPAVRARVVGGGAREPRRPRLPVRVEVPDVDEQLAAVPGAERLLAPRER